MSCFEPKRLKKNLVPNLNQLQYAKQALRRTILAARRDLSDRPARSEQIRRRLLDYLSGRCPRQTLLYMGARDEMETAPLVRHWLAATGQAIVPYCLPGYQLGLFTLQDFAELSPGAYGILEPASHLRADRQASAELLDLAILPGVAYDRHGNRLGHGKGYYDRLLPRLRPDCRRIALAFECQIVAEVPAEPHDIPIETLITEHRIIECERPSSPLSPEERGLG